MKPDTYVPLAILITTVSFIFGVTAGESPNMNLVDLIDVASDIAIGVAAVIASYVALKGLSSWRNEHSGKIDSELAKKILVKTYNFREKIKYLRNPFFLPREIPFDGFNRDMEDDQRNRLEAGKYAKAFGERWIPVGELMVELQEISIEVEALWEPKSVKPIKDLTDHGWELQFAIQDHIEKIAQGDIRESAETTLLFSKRDPSGRDQTDFATSLNKAINDVEDLARSKL